MLPQIVVVNRMARHRRRKHARVKNRHHRHHAARSSNRFHHKRRRRVSNPLSIPGIPKSISGDLVPALLGGAGAVGVDVLLAYLSPYLPATFATGWGRLAAQVAAAIGVGYGVGLGFGKRTGDAAMVGGLVVTAYSGLRQVLAPTIGTSVKGLSGLADFSDYNQAAAGQFAVGGNITGAGLGAYMRPGMGAYMPRAQLGYMNPGAILTGYRQKQGMGAYMARPGISGFGHGPMPNMMNR